MVYLRGLLGILVLLLIGWLLSSNRRRLPWRVIIWGLLLQLMLAGLILGTPWGYAVFDALAGFIAHLIGLTSEGAGFVFGDLADPTTTTGFLLAFAGNGLLVIIFFASLISILYHLGVMQVIIWCLARIMSATMGLSGAESMAGASNIFVGMTEAPLMVRPYIKGMTLSELNAMMTGGFATIAGTVLAVYIGIVGEEYLTHLLTASVMSAPAAFVFAKMIRPETEKPTTWGKCELRIERTAGNVIEAAADGASQGMKLYLNIIAMLIAFIALVALINWPLGWLGEVAFSMPREAAGGTPADPLSLAKIFGWIFAPVAWCMGINGWNDCQLFGALLGTKMAVNEMIAFGELAKFNAQDAFADPRTAKIAAYALCGFSNFGSIGIQLGGITPLAPERKGDLSRLALRAMFGGTLASATTAAIAGMFVE
jgi:CNT family concentrative nucleoside transporter